MKKATLYIREADEGLVKLRKDATILKKWTKKKWALHKLKKMQMKGKM